jgi:hypothetical protein
MNPAVRISVIAASLGLAATFMAWRVSASRRQTSIQIEIVKDRSRSTTDGCDAVIGLAEKAMEIEGISSRSTLTVLLSGDAVTAYEPTVLGTYTIPYSTKVIEGRNANQRNRARLLNDLSSRCRAAHDTSISPIFLAIKHGIEDLHGRGCDAGSRCQLFVDSDLEENVEQAIKNRLNALGKKLPLPATINNTNINVWFCGVAAMTGGILDSSGHVVQKFAMRDSAREDRLKSVWQALFSAPELVTFHPYCPTPSDVAKDRTGGSPPSRD